MFFNDLRQFKKKAKNIHLTSEEKLDMQTALVEFMKVHPSSAVRKNGEARQIEQKQVYTSPFSFLNRKYMFSALAVLLVVTLSGGVSYAAEGVTPESPLYSIKKVNEEIRAALAVSPEKDAQWDVRLVERRLEEATKLAAENKLDAKAEAELSSRLNVQIKEAEAQIKKLEMKGKVNDATQLSSQLTTALAVHGNLLADLVNGNSKVASTSTVTAPAIIKDIKAQADQAAKIKLELDKKANGGVNVDVEAAARARVSSARKAISQAEKAIEDKSDRISNEVRVKAIARLDTAQKLVVDANEKLKADNYHQAMVLANAARDAAQEAKLIANTSAKVKNEIQINNVIKNINLDTIGKTELEIENHKSSSRSNPEVKVKSETENEIELELEHPKVKLNGSNSGSGSLKILN